MLTSSPQSPSRLSIHPPFCTTYTKSITTPTKLSSTNKQTNKLTLDWNNVIDKGYLITCPNADPNGERLKRSKDIIQKTGLDQIVQVKTFQTDDEDRIRGCYNSHISIYKSIQSQYSSKSSYSVLVLEDNVSLSPLLSQSTLTNLKSFQSSNPGSWDMIHLAYIMYVPGLIVRSTPHPSIVRLSTGTQAALGTTAYVISKRGVDAILEYHERHGYTIAIPDLMARLFPESRYAANPMMFHRASKVKSLVNPQLDSLRELLFEPFFYTLWERTMVTTGLGTNTIFASIVTALLIASASSGFTTVGAVRQIVETGGYDGNIAVVAGSGAVSLICLIVLGYGVALAPPPPKKEEEEVIEGGE